MIAPLLLNTAVNLVIGIALLIAWRAAQDQSFSRWFGWAFIAHAINPVAALVWQSGAGPWSVAGICALIATAMSALVLWMVGVSHLAARPIRKTALMSGWVGMLVLGFLLLGAEPRAILVSLATLTMIVGAIALAWLRQMSWYERFAGVAMLLLGLNQYVWVVAGDAGLIWQVCFAIVLRVVLGLVLFYTVISRSSARAGHLRDQLMDLIERSHQGMAVMQDGVMKYTNPAMLRIFGLSADGQALVAARSQWREMTMSESERAVSIDRHRLIVSGELPEAQWTGERRSFDGRKLQLRFSAWRADWDGAPAEQIVVTDDTAHFDAMQTLLHQATHDELTGLPNRSALMLRLRELCASGNPDVPDVPAKPPAPFALVLLDVDRFKLFNEAHCPTVGDDVLRVLARNLQVVLDGRAEVMRLGEDEFALLAPHAGSPDSAYCVASELAQAVRELLTHPLVLAQHLFFLDVSMGIALYPATARHPEALLRAANAAMHEAKRTPGTSVQFAEARFERGSGATLEIEQALRAGMKSDEFSLVYQPKVEAKTGVLVGFEALVRWMRPGVGLVEPQEFISAAERNGVIAPLGNMILTLACQQLADWRQVFGAVVPVAVNVSPLQLLDPNFPDLVVRTLRHFKVPAELLTLEITESAAVMHMDEARAQITQLRAYGIEVALDDFGTGFSSLNMLRSLPLSTVKIDRSLIDPMPEPDAVAVVKAICDLAAVLHLTVVAEGVETTEHAAAARAAGCHALQGYLYARPLSPIDAAVWLGSRPVLNPEPAAGERAPDAGRIEDSVIS